ncbi:hypothetical protein M3J09_008838 [Ascochyta lentis]
MAGEMRGRKGAIGKFSRESSTHGNKLVRHCEDEDPGARVATKNHWLTDEVWIYNTVQFNRKCCSSRQCRKHSHESFICEILSSGTRHLTAIKTYTHKRANLETTKKSSSIIQRQQCSQDLLEILVSSEEATLQSCLLNTLVAVVAFKAHLMQEGPLL